MTIISKYFVFLFFPGYPYNEKDCVIVQKYTYYHISSFFFFCVFLFLVFFFTPHAHKCLLRGKMRRRDSYEQTHFVFYVYKEIENYRSFFCAFCRLMMHLSLLSVWQQSLLLFFFSYFFFFWLICMYNIRWINKLLFFFLFFFLLFSSSST